LESRVRSIPIAFSPEAALFRIVVMAEPEAVRARPYLRHAIISITD